MNNLDSVTERAYRQREQRNAAMMRLINLYATARLGQPQVQQERRKNFYSQISELVRTEDVVTVRITKTLDTGEYVVCIVDPSGKSTSFWTEGVDTCNLPVRSITSY